MDLITEHPALVTVMIGATAVIIFNAIQTWRGR